MTKTMIVAIIKSLTTTTTATTTIRIATALQLTLPYIGQ